MRSSKSFPKIKLFIQLNNSARFEGNCRDRAIVFPSNYESSPQWLSLSNRSVGKRRRDRACQRRGRGGWIFDRGTCARRTTRRDNDPIVNGLIYDLTPDCYSLTSSSGKSIRLGSRENLDSFVATPAKPIRHLSRLSVEKLAELDRGCLQKSVDPEISSCRNKSRTELVLMPLWSADDSSGNRIPAIFPWTAGTFTSSISSTPRTLLPPLD